MSKQKILYSILILFCGIIIISAVSFLIVYFKSNKISNIINKITQPAVYTHFSKLDGSGVSSTLEETPQVITVMIDNHPDALPQSGVSKARVVYEAPVEGSFTRYMAVFLASTTVNEVGPVRSARPYFLDWLREYGIAPYMHSGGSPDALNLIKNSNIFDANEFWRGRYYWRSDDRDAPHNLYTNNVRWQELLQNEQNRHQVKTWEGWKFYTISSTPSYQIDGDTTIRLSSLGVKELIINYNSNYKVSWKFNSKAQNYVRYINNAPVTDKDGSPIIADNILVQYVTIKILDEVGRKEIQTIGDGAARFVSEGLMLTGTWKKLNSNSRTKFYSGGGSGLVLKPGITWVEVAPNGLQLEIGN